MNSETQTLNPQLKGLFGRAVFALPPFSLAGGPIKTRRSFAVYCFFRQIHKNLCFTNRVLRKRSAMSCSTLLRCSQSSELLLLFQHISGLRAGVASQLIRPFLPAFSIWCVASDHFLPAGVAPAGDRGAGGGAGHSGASALGGAAGWHNPPLSTLLHSPSTPHPCHLP